MPESKLRPKRGDTMSAPARLITAITPTACSLLNIVAPSLSELEPLTEVVQARAATLGNNVVQRALIFCPDATG